MAVYGVWFEGRNTPKVVEASSRTHAIAKARKSKTTGHRGRVVSARTLKGSTLKQARRGDWVRERANGTTKGGSFKFRPQLKRKIKRKRRR